MKNFTDFLYDYSDTLYVIAFDTIVAVLVAIGFYLLYRFTRTPLLHLLHSWEVDDYLSNVLVNSVYKSVLVVVGFISALSQLGVNVLAALTGFGVVGIAIGFAAKDTLGNIISGFMIFWDKPFLVGDWIEVDDHYGQVQGITLRSTRIHTSDNYHIVVPNQTIINSVVINHHHARPVRVFAYFDVPYDADVDKAMMILKRVAKDFPELDESHDIGAGVAELKDNGLVNVAVLFWANSAKNAIGADGWMRQHGRDALLEAGYTVPVAVRLTDAPKKATVRKTRVKKTESKDAAK